MNLCAIQYEMYPITMKLNDKADTVRVVGHNLPTQGNLEVPALLTANGIRTWCGLNTTVFCQFPKRL